MFDVPVNEFSYVPAFIHPPPPFLVGTPSFLPSPPPFIHRFIPLVSRYNSSRVLSLLCGKIAGRGKNGSSIPRVIKNLIVRDRASNICDSNDILLLHV